MKLSALGNPRGLSQELQSSTVRDFTGGWNLTDSDLNLAPKYARVLDNFERGTDGTLALRSGTRLFSLIAADKSPIINMTYFNNYIVAVQYSGRFSLIDANGVAGYLPLASTSMDAWPSGVDFVSFTQHNNNLIITNGRNKPLILSGNISDPMYMRLAYLVDQATLSNLFTPIGKYVASHSQFVIFAGLPDKPSVLAISARNTSGTFVGDPAPNDAIELDLGPRVSSGSSTITGLLSYGDKLLVAFENGVLPMTLNVYTGSPSVHTPTDDGFIEEFGGLSHRTMVTVGSEAYYADNIGVDILAKATFNTNLQPTRASELIDPAITASIKALTTEQALNNAFAVYDIKHRRYMLFIPEYNDTGVLVSTVGYSFTDRRAIKVKSWARLIGWRWQCGCRTGRQDIMFAMDNKIYKYDFDEEEAALDFVGDTAYNNGAGVPVSFVWELPWADFDARMANKVSQYIAMDVQGRGTFTLEMYVDRITTAPALTMEFRGDVAHGYGADPYSEAVYGAGRLTGDERLYEWPSEFHTAKLKISGATTKQLKFASISILYRKGALGR